MAEFIDHLINSFLDEVLYVFGVENLGFDGFQKEWNVCLVASFMCKLALAFARCACEGTGFLAFLVDA